MHSQPDWQIPCFQSSPFEERRDSVGMRTDDRRPVIYPAAVHLRFWVGSQLEPGARVRPLS
jgi:hypothetical protein